MRVDSWRDFPVGPAGRAYFLETLSSGLTLGRLLSEVCEREQGTISVRLPAASNPSSVPDFKSGGVLSSEDGDADLAGRIAEFLRGHVGRVCLFENYLARPGDPWLRSAVSRIVVFDREVYHLLSGGATGTDAICAAIREAKSIPVFIGMLSSLPEVDARGGARLGHGERLEQQELALLAHRADEVIVGAYDGEGYLIWSRASDGG